jgi:DNA helicase HerA-like ATPase
MRVTAPAAASLPSLSPAATMAVALEPLRRSQGVRLGVIGRTGSGKTYALRKAVRAALAGLDLAYVLTDEPLTWGDCQIRRDLRDCRDNPLVPASAGGSSLICFEGDVFQRREESPEALAADAWRRCAPPYRFRVAVVVDELRSAAIGGRWNEPGGDLQRAFSQGRKVGLSVFWGTQVPQEVPREAFSQSELWLFELSGRETRYLLGLRLIDEALAEVLPRLGPRRFVVLRSGDWDGAVYQF